MTLPLTAYLGKKSTLLAVALSAGLCAEQPVQAQEASGGATLTSGISYSSRRGGLAFVGLEAANLFQTGVQAKLRFDKGQDGEAASLALSKVWELGDTKFGTNSFVIGTIEGQSEDWASEEFASTQVGGDLRIGADLSPQLGYQLRLFWRSDDLKRLATDVSPLVRAEPSKSDAVGLGFGLNWSSLDNTALPTQGAKLGLDLAWASPLGDRQWMSIAASAKAARPVGEKLVVSFSAEGGHIAGLNGDMVSIVDRAYLGNPMPRGFAAGGLGPRDFVAGPAGTNTALGGNSYMTASVEARMQTANPGLQIGVFADAGATWELDQTAGGASGTIDDSFFLRSSVGVSVYLDSRFGLLQANFASPVRRAQNDVEENFSLGLSMKF